MFLRIQNMCLFTDTYSMFPSLTSDHMCHRWSLCPSRCWTRSPVKMRCFLCRKSSRFMVRIQHAASKTITNMTLSSLVKLVENIDLKNNLRFISLKDFVAVFFNFILHYLPQLSLVSYSLRLAISYLSHKHL